MGRKKVRELLGKGLVRWNPGKGVFEASPELVERDLREFGRSVDLLEEGLVGSVS